MDNNIKNKFDMLNILIEELNSQKNDDNLNIYKKMIIKYINEIQNLTHNDFNGKLEILNLANTQKDIIELININNNRESLKKLLEEYKNNFYTINELLGQNIKINEKKEINEIKENTKKINKHKKVAENIKKRIFNDTDNKIEGDYNKVILEKNNKKAKEYYNFCYSENNTITKFYYKNESKKKIFYYCYKQFKGCPGKANYDKEKKIFTVYVKCEFNIIHESYKYERVELLFNNNKIDNLDFNLKIIQRFYIRYLFKNKIVIDKYAAIDKLKEKFGNIDLKLTDNDLNYEFSKAQPDINDKSIYELIKYLSKEINDFFIKEYDISYDITLYNNNEKKNIKTKREEKLIFFGTNKMYENLKTKSNIQYFIDITYQIIPSKYKPYKLLSIKSFNNEDNKAQLNAMIALKYEDENSLYHSFKYLKDFYGFNPAIINIDYSLSLEKALNGKKLFDIKPKIIKCFFHFSQSIIRKMRNIKLLKKKLNKNTFVILNNIQIISFINTDLVENYIKFLEDKLTEPKEKELMIYIKYLN